MSDFAAILDETLAEGRAFAEVTRLRSQATVRRKTGREAQNESTGREDAEWADVHVGIAFRIAGASNSDGGSHTVTIAGVAYEEATGVGQFPASTDDLQDDDFIDVTSGEWAGSVFRIVAAVGADQKTVRRVPIVEAIRPSEWEES